MINVKLTTSKNAKIKKKIFGFWIVQINIRNSIIKNAKYA